MISEREFVLNNYFHRNLENLGESATIEALKHAYKTVCENTSDGLELANEIDAIMEFIGFGGLTDIAQMHVKRKLFELKEKYLKGTK